MASILFRTLIVYFMLSFSLKIMGKRQIGELEVGELVSTLLVSEIASLPVADSDIPLFSGIIPVLLIVSLEIIISHVKNKTERLKRIVDGTPVFLIFQGKLRQDALKDNRISINELLSEMRSQGYGDISSIYYAILEQNGKISFLKDEKKDAMVHPLIIDGETCKENLSSLGYGTEWLSNELAKRKTDIKDVFLFTVDDSGNTNIIRKEIHK